MNGFLKTGIKSECLGCSACKQACPFFAITMKADYEGFLYPTIDAQKCRNCNLCHHACPIENMPTKNAQAIVAFGGQIKDSTVLAQSTSGGAFTALCQTFCKDHFRIFGVTSDGLRVYHTSISKLSNLSSFRKSKYSQSDMQSVYIETREALKKGINVLFSGTPCQIAGLYSFLGSKEFHNLLTIEVICEGVPSPLFMQKVDSYCQKKYKAGIFAIDYRKKCLKMKKKHAYGKWDFQVMELVLQNGKTISKDRWFNPFWSIWLQHLISRPSCYQCPFTTKEREADITLGDLWGVHLFCPDLYFHNSGSSLILANSRKGETVLKEAKLLLQGRDILPAEAICYQSPLRKPISSNPFREQCIEDLASKDISYLHFVKKWSKPSSIRLLVSKYFWGNRQKVALWNFKKRFNRRKR